MGKPVAATFQHRQVQETAHWTKQRQAPVLYEPDLQTPLGETELEKDLGVWIDNNLAFTQHCEKQTTKANRILGMIRRSYSFLEDSVTRLEYEYPAWSPQYRKDCELLENVQRRATKLAPALKDLSYEDKLRSLDLPSLNYRRARGDVIQIYKTCKRTVQHPGTIHQNRPTRNQRAQVQTAEGQSCKESEAKFPNRTCSQHVEPTTTRSRRSTQPELFQNQDRQIVEKVSV